MTRSGHAAGSATRDALRQSLGEKVLTIYDECRAERRSASKHDVMSPQPATAPRVESDRHGCNTDTAGSWHAFFRRSAARADPIWDRDLPGDIRNAFGLSKINKLLKSSNLDFDAPAVVSRESDAIGLKQYRYWQHPPADPAQREKQCV